MKLHDSVTRGTTARKSHKVLILAIHNISRIWRCSVKSENPRLRPLIQWFSHGRKLPGDARSSVSKFRESV